MRKEVFCLYYRKCFWKIIKDKEEENTMRGCGSTSAEALGPKIQSLKDLLLEPS